MKKEYDLSKMKSVRRGPALNRKTAKVAKSLRLDHEIFEWAYIESEKRGVGYQTFINMALREMMTKPSLEERVARLEKKLSKGA